MRTALTLLILTILPACASRAPTITAAFFLQQSSPDTFTLQGVLSDKGDRLNETLDIKAVLVDETSGSELVAAELHSVEVVDGLFTLEIPLPEPGALLAADDPALHLINPDTQAPYADPIPLRHTPLAWASRHAEYADEAGTAAIATNAVQTEFATTAAYADTAATLTDADAQPVTLVNLWDNFNDPGAPILARRLGGMVFLSGSLLRIPPNIDGQVLTLPEGFRPGEIVRPPVRAPSTGDPISITIYPNGTMTFSCTFAISNLYLDGISFPVASP
ncbi:MAG: hypothetical protein ACF8Q5_10130 [Phycisphaerales bacterium JB040]